jgi:hypothetical protein
MSNFGDPSFVRVEGLTDAERYLGGGGKKGEGKELCDLLVVFGNDILIFSDKSCEFKNTGNLELDWTRWFRKAVLKSADQIWGAERWIREHRNRLFLDRACRKPFPIDFPDPATVRFHRIVVAHQVSDRCRQELGGSGSLIIDTSVVGDAHAKTPFTILC